MKRFSLILIVLSLTAIIAHAAGRTVAGVVTRVDPSAIDVRLDNNETSSVAVNENTLYRKWILAKPWGQDPRANANDVTVGMRVRIDVARDNPSIAKTVWLVFGRVGYPDPPLIY
jgi:hypothetical protein